jgi:hypothetical protein
MHGTHNVKKKKNIVTFTSHVMSLRVVTVLSRRRPLFNPRPVHVGLQWEKHWDRFLPRVLLFLLARKILLKLHTLN